MHNQTYIDVIRNLTKEATHELNREITSHKLVKDAFFTSILNLFQQNNLSKELHEQLGKTFDHLSPTDHGCLLEASIKNDVKQITMLLRY